MKITNYLDVMGVSKSFYFAQLLTVIILFVESLSLTKSSAIIWIWYVKNSPFYVTKVSQNFFVKKNKYFNTKGLWNS